jgi:hypothetical protein
VSAFLYKVGCVLNFRKLQLYKRKTMVSLGNLGVKYTIRRILEETMLKKLFLFRNFIIYDKDLTKLNNVRLQNPKLKFSFISEDNPEILEELEEISGFSRDLIMERLQTGSDCLVAMEGNKVVGFNMVSFGNVYIHYLEQYMNLLESEAWNEQISVSNQYRYQGIAADLRNVMFKHLKEKDYARCIGGTLQINVKARMLARRTGFIEREKVTFIRMLKRKKYYSQKL